MVERVTLFLLLLRARLTPAKGLVKMQKCERLFLSRPMLARPGDMRRLETPNRSRTYEFDIGARRRPRLTMSNWRLSATGSAISAPTPPGPASFATVVSRWAISMTRRF